MNRPFLCFVDMSRTFCKVIKKGILKDNNNNNNNNLLEIRR